VDERIGRAEVNADVAGEEVIDSVKHGAMVAPTPQTPTLPLWRLGTPDRGLLRTNAHPPTMADHQVVKELNIE